jgi:hypothetical protein
MRPSLVAIGLAHVETLGSRSEKRELAVRERDALHDLRVVRAPDENRRR